MQIFLGMTINERFDTIIKILFAGNKRAFAIHVGVSPTVVENVVGTRQGKPSFDFLVKVCANANISAEWLLLETGEMWRDMFEFRKPMVMHSDPERYIQEGKKEITDDEDVFSQEIIEPIQTSGQNSEAHALLLQLLKEKDNEIGNLREEIGRLKAENAEIKRHAERLAGLANTDSTAHVG